MLTQEYVRSLFDYDPVKGVMTRRVRRGPRGAVGREVGKTKKSSKGGRSYKVVHINRKAYMLHRLIWLHVHGYFPEHYIDHINRNPLDNRLDNLREATNMCNQRNTGNHKHNSSGIKGVMWDRSMFAWFASVTVMGEEKPLGHYRDFDDAVCARLAAEQCLDWAGCDSNSPAYQYVQSIFRWRRLF